MPLLTHWAFSSWKNCSDGSSFRFRFSSWAILTYKGRKEHSGTKKEPKPKLLSPDIFWWGGGLPREGVGAKKFGMSLETQGIKLFWRDIPGFCRDIPEVPEKLEKKMFGFNSRPLNTKLNFLWPKMARLGPPSWPPKFRLKKFTWVPFFSPFPGNEAHKLFSGGPKWGVLGGGQKVYVEKVYVLFPSPISQPPIAPSFFWLGRAIHGPMPV